MSYLATLLFFAAFEAAVGREALEFSLIISFGQDGFNSSGTVPAINLALEHIDQTDQVLPGYKLQHGRVQDSECNRGSSLDAFFKEVQSRSEPTKIALVGCGCSVATEPVAEISHRWNISQISFASAVSTLSDRTRFKNYFRTYPTFENFAPAVLAVLNHYNWKRIAFLTQDANLFNKLYSDFAELVDRLAANETDICCFNTTDITVLNRPFQTNSDPIPAVEDVLTGLPQNIPHLQHAPWLFDCPLCTLGCVVAPLLRQTNALNSAQSMQEKDGDYRVFMMNSYSAIAREVICEAAKRGLVYPNYAWIIYGWYPEEWWTTAVSGNETVKCTDEELEEFLKNARPIIIQQYPAPDDVNDMTDIAGITSAEFDQLYDQRIKEENYDKTIVYGIAYDAIWALALGLNATQEMVERNDSAETGCSNTSGRLVPLHEFDYSNEMMGCVIRWNLEQTNFTGVSGRVIFDANGTIIQNRIRLLQYRTENTDNDSTVIKDRYGYVDRTSNWALTYEAMESDSTVFPDGVPPDGTPRVVIHSYNTGLVAAYYLLAVVGIVFAAICLIFNFVFRNRKVVQLTSPKLNSLIVAGAFLMYTSLFIGVLPSTSEDVIHAQCILHTWLHFTGYLLVFGTMLAKMWRVYHIFHNPTPNKMLLRDWHLVMIVFLVTGVGVFLITIKSGLEYEPPILVRDKQHKEGRTELGVREDYYVYECYDTSSPPFYCSLLIFAYLAILQLVGIILAFQTRKVKIPILNDSKYVAALIYISSIILVILAFVTVPLGGYINVRAAIFCGGILLLATIFLALTFVPKMTNLYRDPRGEKIFSKSNPTNTAGGDPDSKSVPHGTSLHAVEGSGDLIPLLQSQIKEQKEVIQAREKRINELEEILSTFKGSLNGDVSESQSC